MISLLLLSPTFGLLWWESKIERNWDFMFSLLPPLPSALLVATLAQDRCICICDYNPCILYFHSQSALLSPSGCDSCPKSRGVCDVCRLKHFMNEKRHSFFELRNADFAFLPFPMFDTIVKFQGWLGPWDRRALFAPSGQVFSFKYIVFWKLCFWDCIL